MVTAAETRTYLNERTFEPKRENIEQFAVEFRGNREGFSFPSNEERKLKRQNNLQNRWKKFLVNADKRTRENVDNGKLQNVVYPETGTTVRTIRMAKALKWAAKMPFDMMLEQYQQLDLFEIHAETKALVQEAMEMTMTDTEQTQFETFQNDQETAGGKIQWGDTQTD